MHQIPEPVGIFSSDEYCLRFARRMSLIARAPPVCLFSDFWPIFVPFGHYDEPEILRYAITSICPKGADVRHGADGAALVVVLSPPLGSEE